MLSWIEKIGKHCLKKYKYCVHFIPSLTPASILNFGSGSGLFTTKIRSARADEDIGKIGKQHVEDEVEDKAMKAIFGLSRLELGVRGDLSMQHASRHFNEGESHGLGYGRTAVYGRVVLVISSNNQTVSYVRVTRELLAVADCENMYCVGWEFGISDRGRRPYGYPSSRSALIR